MEPKERPTLRKHEKKNKELGFVTASLERLKLCGLPEIRTMVTWADISLTKNTSENRTRVTSLPEADKERFPNTKVRLVMAGDSPDNLHFQLRIDTHAFSDKGAEQTDAALIPYFSIIAAFEKAVKAESLDVADTDITYADNYITIYGQAYELQLQYQEWINQQSVQQENASKTRVFPNVQETRTHIKARLEKILFGSLPQGMLRVDFGIHDYLVLINADLPEMYERMREQGTPFLEAGNLAGHPALQQGFLSELRLLLTLYRQPDESFEQAVIAIVSKDMLKALQSPVNRRQLSELIDESHHPLRSFVYVRAMLFQQILNHAVALYHSIEIPEIQQLRDFRESATDINDLRLFGAIATGDLLLDRIDMGYHNFGFGENDRRGLG